jgi:hypothetical protein
MIDVPIGTHSGGTVGLNKGRVGCYDPTMQLEQIVALLVAERDRFDAAIQALQGPAKHAGFSPGKKTSAPEVVAKPAARKRGLSAAGRKAIGDAARKRWAAIKAAKASPSPVKPAVKGKRGVSSAGRKAMAAAAKKRWAAIKAGKAPNPFAKPKAKAAKKG